MILTLSVAAPSIALERYRLPEPAIVKILDTPPLPFVRRDPTGQTLVLMEREAMPSIADMAAPMLRLAGFRVNPVTNGPHGPRSFVGLTLQHLDDGPAMKVALPDGAGLYVSMIPAGRGALPEAPRVPLGPVVQETSGRTAPVCTYQDLLESPYDEALFDYLFTAQIVHLDLESGQLHPIGQPGIYAGMAPSPSGTSPAAAGPPIARQRAADPGAPALRTGFWLRHELSHLIPVPEPEAISHTLDRCHGRRR